MSAKQIKNNQPIKLQQWKKRIVCFKFIYSFLVAELPQQAVLNKLKDELSSLNDGDVFRLIFFCIQNKEYFTKIIKDNLKPSWSLERLNFVDLAIVYLSLSEFFCWKLDKRIVIDQAIITAKKYSEKNAYRFINYLLDKILIQKYA